MRFLLWNIARAAPAENVQPPSPTTNVRIVLHRGPAAYSIEWMVMPGAHRRRLNKKELHELEMRVTKYVDTLNPTPSAMPAQSIFFASL